MSTASPTSSLADLPDDILWSSRPWTDFPAAGGPGPTLALLPVFGFADWGLGRPLDLEEMLGCGVLRALPAATTRSPDLAILPPLRFALGPYPHCLFGIDYETALDLVTELGTGVAAAGVRRLVFFNTSPWNEELLETCACDLRADLGLQTFVIHLAALGLDLHPARSTTRPAAQAAACALTRRAPAGHAPRADQRLVDFRPGDHRQPPPLPWTRSLDAAISEGETRLAAAGARLATLLAQVAARPHLPGAAPRMRAPAPASPKKAPGKQAKRSATKPSAPRKKGHRRAP